MSELVVLSLLFQKVIKRFKAKPQCDVVRVRIGLSLRLEPPLINYATYQDEVTLLDNFGEMPKKMKPLLSTTENIESASLTPYFVLVQNNLVMTEVVELEFLQGRNNLLAVMALVKDTKGEHKYWITLVYRLHSVVATFIYIDYVFAEAAPAGGGGLAPGLLVKAASVY
tara:strand:- start:29726 stop:30232 length:507 start_codon:yes stop_codon:yes gene_type:complete